MQGEAMVDSLSWPDLKDATVVLGGVLSLLRDVAGAQALPPALQAEVEQALPVLQSFLGELRQA